MKFPTKISAILVPSLAPFLIFSLIGKQLPDDFSGNQSSASDVVNSLLYFYRHALPLLAFAAILSQYLIVIPIWNRGAVKGNVAKLGGLLLLLLLCLGSSFAFAYAIWDRADGTGWLIDVSLAVTGMQLIYWVINLGLLAILHHTTKTKTPAIADADIEKEP